jgi:hypothetical protein
LAISLSYITLHRHRTRPLSCAPSEGCAGDTAAAVEAVATAEVKAVAAAAVEAEAAAAVEAVAAAAVEAVAAAAVKAVAAAAVEAEAAAAVEAEAAAARLRLDWLLAGRLHHVNCARESVDRSDAAA